MLKTMLQLPDVSMDLSRTNLARLILSHFLIRLRDCGNTVFKTWPCNNMQRGMLINRLVKYRLVGMTNKWVHCWLENLIRVLISGFSWGEVSTRIPHSSELSLMMLMER